MEKKIRAYDILGDIAIVKFPRDWSLHEKKKFGERILVRNNSVKTVLEKTGKFKGRLRKQETRFLCGVKNKEVVYKENGCVFRFHVDGTYFSPRLSNERKEVASLIKNGEDVFVMFAGVAPFSIVVAKNSRAGKVYNNEINRVANKYARLNVELNKVRNKIEFLDGDVKRVVEKLKKKFDVIVMPRPQLKNSFLEQAFAVSKKGTRIFYYDFCEVGKEKEIVEKVKTEAKKSGKKVKILKVQKAGEVAPYRLRVRVDFGVL